MKIELTPRLADILDHTIHRAVGGFYCGGVADMKSLVAAGFMQSAGWKPFVPDEYFKITQAGREALRKWQAAQPKPKPVKRRRRSPAFDSWRSYVESYGRTPFPKFLNDVWPRLDTFSR